jgi:molybdopterin converting factor small subunit
VGKTHVLKIPVDRSRVLAVTGPLAMAGALAAAWGGSYLRTDQPGRVPVSIAAAAGADAAGLLTSQTITVRVRPPHELMGLATDQEISVTLPRGSTVGALQARLAEMYPELTPMMPNLFIAVADEMQSSAWVLTDGEAIDLVAPMAGG